MALEPPLAVEPSARLVEQTYVVHAPDSTPGYTLGAVAAPVTRDQELELRIDSLAFGGNGVARLDGFVVFVRRGLPGDTVRARVTKVQRRHAEALATEVLEPGPQRVEAPCAHFRACGGCRFQDLAYEAQLEAKQAQVEDSLRRIAGIAEPPLEPIVPADRVFGYRNKMEYSFAPDPSRARARPPPRRPLGRGARRSSAASSRPTSATRSATPIQDWAREERLPAYDQADDTGYLRHLVVREGRNTGQALVQLVTARARALRPRRPDRGAHGVSRRSARSTGPSTTRPPRSRTCPSRCSGARRRSRRRSAACASASARTRSCRRTREMAERCTSCAIEAAGLTGDGDGLRPLLRHRHDRPRARRRTR